MFRENLSRRGIHSFVPFDTLHTQWIWMRNTGHLVWADVHKETVFDLEGKWKNVIQQIKSTAVNLRLQLREKTEDDIDTNRWGSRVIVSGPRTLPLGPAIMDAQTTTTLSLPLPPMSSSETPRHMTSPPCLSEQQQMSRYFAESDDQRGESIIANLSYNQQQTNHRGSNRSVVTSYGKVCIWCEHGTTLDKPDSHNDQSQLNDLEQNEHHDQIQEAEEQDQEPHGQNQQQHNQDQAMQSVPAEKLPPLLYRWSNRDSQGVNSKTYYRAGLFCNGQWFDPEDFSENQFLSFFRSHVTKEKKKTPFISTSLSPLAPIHRALVNQNGAIVTVIDTSKLNTKVFYAYPLAVRTRTLVQFGWKGYGEYLIWGHIPTEAIAFTLEITGLEGLTNTHRDINRLMQIFLIRSLRCCDDRMGDMLASKMKSPFKSGRTLAKLLTLLEVPKIHWDNIAYGFAKKWGFREEMTQFCSGVKSGPPYLPEELSDSESEVVLLQRPPKAPGNSPSKRIPSSDSVSDLDYEPPGTDEGSEGTSHTDGPNDSQSESMYDKTETADNGNFSTHETLSSGSFPEGYGPDGSSERLHTKEMMDVTSDNEDTCSQQALQRDWPSDDERYPDTPTPIEVRIPRTFERRSSPQFDRRSLPNMDLAERMRLLYPHEIRETM